MNEVELGEAVIRHMLPGKEGGTAGGSGKKFDESRVKRDGNGKFASRESRQLDPRDLKWASDLQGLNLKVMQEAWPDLVSIYEANGIDVDKWLEKGESAGPSDSQLASMREPLMNTMNKTAERVAVSPSGTQKLEYYPDPSNKRDLKHRIVPYKSKVKHSEIELGEAALEHIGVKGMKWGVRKSDSSSAVSRAGQLGASVKKPTPKEAHEFMSAGEKVAKLTATYSNAVLSMAGAAALTLAGGLFYESIPTPVLETSLKVAWGAIGVNTAYETGKVAADSVGKFKAKRATA